MPQSLGKQKFIDMLSQAAILLVLFAPVTYAINLGLLSHKGEPAGPYVTVVDLLALVFTAAFAITIIVKREYRRLRIPPFAAIALFLWFAFGFFRITPEVQVGKAGILKESLQVLEFLCFGFALFLTAMHDRRTVGLFLDTLTVAVTGVIGYGLYQYFSYDIPAFEVSSVLTNNSVLSAFLAISLPLVIANSLSADTHARKAWALLLLLGSIPLVMNGWFLGALFISLGVFAGLYGRWFALIGLFALLLLVAIIVPNLPRDNGGRLLETTQLYHRLDNDDARALMKTHVVSVRVRNWQAALLAAADRPLLGYGPSSYSNAVRPNFYFDAKYTARTDDPTAFDIHVDEPSSFSTYAVLLVEQGVIGLLIFLSLIIAAIRWSLVACYCGKPVAVLGKGALCSLIALVISAQFTYVFDRGLAFVMVFTFALAFTVYEYARGYREA
ncbi:MAG: O-antigen ligase family protein [Planctomycetota bacterium]|nr:O-antigen ligase family protein [Planctomycetota bacterium]